MAKQINFRKQRLAKDIQRLISELVYREIHDQRVANSSPCVTNVQLSPDISHAKVYITFANPNSSNKDKEVALDILRGSEGYFRSIIGKRFSIKAAPEIHIFYDDTLDEVKRIQEDLAAEKAEIEAIKANSKV